MRADCSAALLRAAQPADPLRFLAEKLQQGGVDEKQAKKLITAICPPVTAPAPAPGAAGLVCPCNLFGELSYGEPIISKHDKTVHPPWYPSQAGQDLGLRVHNTLTETTVPFIPGRGKRVLWYTCGPTVYDACHMGHARAYLTFDILRRIIEDYFRYEVLYQINITDIDDKIILRARRNKLLDDFRAGGGGDYDVVAAEATEAVQSKGAKLDKKAAKLAATVLPADTPSRDVEAHETEIATTALKKRQFEDINASLETIKAVASGGGAKAAEILGALCSEAGVASSSADALEAALKEQTVAVNEGIEVTRDELERGAKVEGKLKELGEQSAKIGSMQAKLSALVAAQKDATEALYTFAGSEISEKLDAEKGATVTDHEIFNAHARFWEGKFLEDMAALGVKDPDVMTRVTEYVPKIVDFVQKIMDKGLAYAANGSVYLDIGAFKDQGHHYRKLVPFSGETSGNAPLLASHFHAHQRGPNDARLLAEADMAEGEGELAAEASEKKNANDFALWKASKPGEPSWESPWGGGRPGWHIECSVVAGDILVRMPSGSDRAFWPRVLRCCLAQGANMDIHAGGSDLKFPHHDNELAQSEAYYGHHQWCNYFFHAGHLHIKGLKMSKSLKNFTTIQQALKEYSARQLRLMFLMQPWDRPMNFSDQTVGAAKAKEAQFKNFFGTVKALLRTKWIEEEVGWRDIDVDRALSISILDTQSKVHAAFCDNFDTPSAINALTALVTECNNYLARPPPAAPAVYLLQKAGVYITQILKVLGVAEGSDEIGFPVSNAGSEAEVEGPLDALTEFRDTVRASKRRSCLPPLLFGCVNPALTRAVAQLPARRARLTQSSPRAMRCLPPRSPPSLWRRGSASRSPRCSPTSARQSGRRRSAATSPSSTPATTCATTPSPRSACGSKTRRARANPAHGSLTTQRR